MGAIAWRSHARGLPAVAQDVINRLVLKRTQTVVISCHKRQGQRRDRLSDSGRWLLAGTAHCGIFVWISVSSHYPRPASASSW